MYIQKKWRMISMVARFETMQSRVLKAGESGQIEVKLVKCTDEGREVKFIDIYRSYKDQEGIFHKKGSMTLPLSCAGDIAKAIAELAVL
jgi:hypothetical protein